MSLLRKVGKGLARIGAGALALALLATVAIVIAGAAVILPGERATPAGVLRNQSYYVQMRDGAEIAVDVWLPPDFDTERKYPAIARFTPYWRQQELTLIGRGLYAIGLLDDSAYLGFEHYQTLTLNDSGYVMVLIDVRGTGASRGTRPILFSDDEVADYGEIIDWIAARDWSNGNVGTIGTSYEGIAAMLATSTRRPALKAAAPLFAPYDSATDVFMNGGVFNERVARMWSQAQRGFDRNDICLAWGTMCRILVQAVTKGVKPVDGEVGRSKLEHFLATRLMEYPDTALRDFEFTDDEYGRSGATLAAVSEDSRRQAIAASGVPIFAVAGWLDAAIVRGTLRRYRALPNSQTVLIGSLSHLDGRTGTDQFNPEASGPNPPTEERYRQITAFFDSHLKEQISTVTPSTLSYLTLNENVWHSTSVWPPAHVQSVKFFLKPDRKLAGAGAVTAGADVLEVDFATSSGSSNRWNSLYGGRVNYGDRRDLAGTLAYVTAPLDVDTEISGAARIEIFVSFSTTDGALHAYLDDIAPDGRATYISEGALRAVFRETPPEQRSYARAQATPVVPDQPTLLAFDLIDTSVLIRRGHRLRLGIAGADASTFGRYPRNGAAPRLSIHHGREHPSAITLPVSERRAN